MKSISVVLNARLGSTRYPQKLIRSFAGTTLIEIALEKLNQLDFFDHRYFAIAEKPLRKLAKNLEHVEILERDPIAVTEKASFEQIYGHFEFVPSEWILILNPCLPALTTSTIRDCVDYFQNHDHPSYTTSIPTRDWVFDPDGVPLTNKDPKNVTTNKGQVFSKAAHAFHIVNRDFVLKHGYFWPWKKNDPHLIPIPESNAVDVDFEFDFYCAELFYKKNVLRQDI